MNIAIYKLTAHHYVYMSNCELVHLLFLKDFIGGKRMGWDMGHSTQLGLLSTFGSLFE